MKAHSRELRERVVQAVERGEHSKAEIARVFGVGERWIRKLMARWRETGSVAPLPHGGGPPPKITPAVREQLEEFVAERPDATLREIQTGCGLAVSLTAISDALRRWGLTRKKKVTRAAEQDRPDVQAQRRSWRRRERKMDAKRLIFVDETGVSTQGVRRGLRFLG